MGQIKTIGTFLFDVIEGAIGVAGTGAAQWNAQLVATAAWDEETEQWVDYSNYEDREIRAFLTLFSKDNKALQNAKQLCKITGWDGMDFQVLDQFDWSKTQIQGRIQEDTYNNKTALKVQWIDAADANPGRNLQRLDPDALKKLNAKFATGMRELGGGVKPKSVPAAPIAPLPAPAPIIPSAKSPDSVPLIPAPANPVTQVDPKAKYEAKKERAKKAEAKAAAVEAKLPPKPPMPPTVTVNPPKADVQQKYGLPVTCTQLEAWEQCCQNRKITVDDDDLANIWVQIIGDIGGEEVVGEDWYKVRDGVLEIVGK